jgi:hypothetical protein
MGDSSLSNKCRYWCQEEVSFEKLVSRLLAGLFSALHEIVREFWEAFNKGLPRALFREENHGIPRFLDQYPVPTKPILFGQPHRLTLAISEQTCCLHVIPPIYTFNIYLK